MPLYHVVGSLFKIYKNRFYGDRSWRDIDADRSSGDFC